MDPRIIKGLTVLAGIAVYAAASYLPPEQAEYVRQLVALLVGSQTIRRAGDFGPLSGKGDQ